MAHDITLGQILLDTSAVSPAYPNVAKFGDIDGDGDLDIVIGVDKAAGTKGSEVWENDGSGNFRLLQTLAGLRVQDLWLVNIDGDSALEMITQEIGASPRVWQNDGFGTFTSVATPTGNTSDVAVGDVDGDGNVDLVVGRWQQSQYEIYKNNGAGTFTLASSVTGAGYVRSVALVDMDRNGTLDIVAFEQAVGGRMLSNDGTGTFTSVATFGDSYGYDVRVADLSGDGHADLIVNGGSGTSEPFRLYRNDGSFSLGAELQTFATGLPTPSVFGDIDNDGDIDGLGHALLLNSGSGTFTNSNTVLQDPAILYYGTVPDGQVIGLGDADGDGDLDFVVSFAGYDYNASTHLSRVRLVINNSPVSNSDGTLTLGSGVAEPVSLPTSADTVGEAVNVFDFTLADGGGGDGVALGVSSLVVHTSGTGDFSKVTWRLNGPDATNVAGIYNAGSNTITFSGLGISVNDGGTETYTINAYFNNTTGLTSGQTYLLSIDGDTDVTTTSGSTRMAASQSPVNNGSGSAIIANTAPTATNLTQNFVFFEDSSDVALEDIVITDPDSSDTFTATLTLSNAAAGSLTTGTFGGSTSTYNPGTGQWIVAGTLDDVNAALASVSFAPAANWDQSVTITTQVRDSSGSGPTNGTITL